MTSSPPTSPPSPANNSTNPSPPTAPTYTQIYDQLSSEWPSLKDKLMQPAPITLPIVAEPNPLDGDE